MKNFIELPFEIDIDLLQKDFRKFPEKDWKEVVSPFVNDGGMWGLDLLEIDIENTIPGSAPAFKFIPRLAHCPYLNEFLSQFNIYNVVRARFNLLKPGEGIEPHADPYGYERGQVRLHIPIITNDKFLFHVEGIAYTMPAGKCYYTNTLLKHHVINNGDESRIHLVIDYLLDEWIESKFAQAA